MAHQNIQDRRRNIAKSAFLRILAFRGRLVDRELELLRVASHNERHRVRGVCGVRSTRLGIDHLFRVTVIGSDEENVTRLFARFVHRADSFVGVRDGFDGGVVDTCVADL
jgi:hypothetical protein